MDWIKQNWDRAVLTLVGLVAIGLAAMFVLKSQRYPDTFQIEKATPNDELPVPETARVESARGFLDKEVKWVLPQKGTPPKALPLFVSIPIIEKGGVLIDITDPKSPPIRPPATNPWLLDHKLDFLDGGVMTQDPDKDDFTNEAEWNAKTDPRDAASHPPYTEKLRLVSRKQQSYKLQFVAMPDEQRFQVVKLPTAVNPARQNFMLRAGEVSPDQQFRVESVEKKQARNNLGITVDASELTITYLPSNEKVVLVRGLEVTIPTYFAEFIFEIGSKEPFFVKKGDSFALPIDPATKYKLIDIQEQEAEISHEPEPGKEVRQKIVPKK